MRQAIRVRRLLQDESASDEKPWLLLVAKASKIRVQMDTHVHQADELVLDGLGFTLGLQFGVADLQTTQQQACHNFRLGHVQVPVRGPAPALTLSISLTSHDRQAKLGGRLSSVDTECGRRRSPINH